VESNIATLRTADINFSYLLAVLAQTEATKIDISNTVAFLGYFDYMLFSTKKARE